MDEDTVIKAVMGAFLGVMAVLILLLLIAGILHNPLFAIVPIGGVIGAILMTKPEWITKMWKQKEYRE